MQRTRRQWPRVYWLRSYYDTNKHKQAFEDGHWHVTIFSTTPGIFKRQEKMTRWEWIRNQEPNAPGTKLSKENCSQLNLKRSITFMKYKWAYHFWTKCLTTKKFSYVKKFAWLWMSSKKWHHSIHRLFKIILQPKKKRFKKRRKKRRGNWFQGKSRKPQLSCRLQFKMF